MPELVGSRRDAEKRGLSLPSGAHSTVRGWGAGTGMPLYHTGRTAYTKSGWEEE